MRTDKDTRSQESTAHAPSDHRAVYIKPYVVDGESGYAVHMADGSPVGWYKDRSVAAAAAIQNDLEPHSVH